MGNIKEADWEYELPCMVLHSRKDQSDRRIHGVTDMERDLPCNYWVTCALLMRVDKVGPE